MGVLPSWLITSQSHHTEALGFNTQIVCVCVCVCVCARVRARAQSLSRIRLCNSMHCSMPGSSVYGISQQEYWSGLPFPSPGNLPDPGVKTSSLASPALAGRFFTTAPPTGFRGTQTLNPYKGERMNKQDCAMLCLKVAHIRRGSTIQGKEHPNVCVCQVASVMSDSLWPHGL